MQSPHVNYPLFMSDFNDTWIFSIDFREVLEYQIPLKSVQWESRADGQTDMTKLTVAFRSFSNAPKNSVFPVVNVMTDTAPLFGKKTILSGGHI